MIDQVQWLLRELERATLHARQAHERGDTKAMWRYIGETRAYTDALVLLRQQEAQQ